MALCESEIIYIILVYIYTYVEKYREGNVNAPPLPITSLQY